MLFSRIVEPPSFFSTEIARTAIGIDALTVRPARKPRYTVDAPNSRPKSAPMITALAVNSAGDCDGGTYGWNAGGVGVVAGMAIGGECSMEVFCYNRPLACENSEQRRRSGVGGQAESRPGFRAHHQPAFRIPPLPQRARGRRRPHDFIPGA